MFKTAATKIAHNSTIPALAGNKDLRPLQDLITAEKSVIVSSVSIHNCGILVWVLKLHVLKVAKAQRRLRQSLGSIADMGIG